MHGEDAMRVDALIFDLDGTLANTLDDIADSMNVVLGRFGLPTHGRDAYRVFVGEGVAKLAERAVPPDRADLVKAVISAFRERYAEHMLDQAAPYPGVPDLLDALAGRGVPLAVLSNKPDALTAHIVRAIFPRTRFSAVRGQREGVPRKPDPTVAIALARELATDPRDCGFVGDTRTDMETAVAAGMVAIGVLWGFRDRAELVEHGAKVLLERPEQLVSLVGDGAARA